MHFKKCSKCCFVHANSYEPVFIPVAQGVHGNSLFSWPKQEWHEIQEAFTAPSALHTGKKATTIHKRILLIASKKASQWKGSSQRKRMNKSRPLSWPNTEHTLPLQLNGNPLLNFKSNSALKNGWDEGVKVINFSACANSSCWLWTSSLMNVDHASTKLAHMLIINLNFNYEQSKNFTARESKYCKLPKLIFCACYLQISATLLPYILHHK